MNKIVNEAKINKLESVKIFEQDAGFVEKLSQVLSALGFRVTGSKDDYSLIVEKKEQEK